MGTNRRPLDSGSGGSEATDFIQYINGQEPQIHELWCLSLDVISCKTHPTVGVDVVAETVGEFETNYLAKMYAELISQGNFPSIIVSNFWVCLTKPGEVDCCLFTTCWNTLRPKGEEVPTIPIRTGEGCSMTLKSLQMTPGVLPLTPVLLTCRGLLFIHTPPDVVSMTNYFLAGINSVYGANIISAIHWSIPMFIPGGKRGMVRLLNNFFSKFLLLV